MYRYPTVFISFLKCSIPSDRNKIDPTKNTRKLGTSNPGIMNHDIMKIRTTTVKKRFHLRNNFLPPLSTTSQILINVISKSECNLTALKLHSDSLIIKGL
jgi:hypothetical protein